VDPRAYATDRKDEGCWVVVQFAYAPGRMSRRSFATPEKRLRWMTTRRDFRMSHYRLLRGKDFGGLDRVSVMIGQISHYRFSFRLLNGPLPKKYRIGFVISHDPFPKYAIEQLCVVEVRTFEVEAFGCICPPRTIVQRFYRGRYRPVAVILALRHEIRIYGRHTEDSGNDRDIRMQIGLLGEQVGHGLNVRVVEAEVIDAEDVFNRPNDIDGIVIGVDYGARLVVRGNNVAR
jgi:hypothetical protein